MSTRGRFLTALTVLVMATASVSVHALEKQPHIGKSEVVMKTGNRLRLFHSGTADVRKEICQNDVLRVYREILAGGHSQSKEVGKVKVTGYEGEHYFTAEVVGGEIKPGDIARKEAASCLVQPAR